MTMTSITSFVNRMSEATNPLLKLVAEASGARHVGFTIHSSYAEMVVMTNDKWRSDASGLPMNGYLLATSLDPANFATAAEIDRRVVVLRIIGRTDLSTDRDTVSALMRHFQDNPDTRDPSLTGMEPLSRAILQWSGVKCKVLGTFHSSESGQMVFGADIEDFFASRQMCVVKPGREALETIVNFVDPIRMERARQDAVEMGMKKPPKPFRIGRVRFTSSSHMGASEAEVPVCIFPGDFLARRTAVFGMTRTGKSNTTKTMVSAVALSAFETDLPIGQLIFDINGEYSNANGQDKGSLADAFADNSVRYRAMVTPGFKDIRLNFYDSLDLGLSFIAHNIKEDSGTLGEDLQTFVSLDLSKPDPSDYQAVTRWERRKSIYQSILHRSGYPAPSSLQVRIDAGSDALDVLYANLAAIDPEKTAKNKETRGAKVREYFGFTEARSPYMVDPETAKNFWLQVRDVEMNLDGYKGESNGIRTDSGRKKWLDTVDGALLSMLAGRSGKNDTPIRSTNLIRNAALQFHSPVGSDNVGRDIYNYLARGRIVIVDLSVGPPVVRERMAERIARQIFDLSSEQFTSGNRPPKIVLYVEEAHNLIGKKADLNETWPRIAKEGAKYGIALVYATQEPSSIHPNILANTENLFVTHLNNDGEIRALSSYYDFSDFTESLKRCQDVGFARVKTLSSNFTISTQVDEFKVAEVKAKFDAAKAGLGSTWFQPVLDGKV